MYVVSTPTGEIYGCSRGCVATLMEFLDRSMCAIALAVRRAETDRDVFCASCGSPLGHRRRSARLLHELMTQTGWDLYRSLSERSRAC